jgi:hypothetical protein
MSVALSVLGIALGVLLLIGGSLQLVTVWKPSLFPSSKFFGIASTAFMMNMRRSRPVRTIWGLFAVVAGVFLLVRSA